MDWLWIFYLAAGAAAATGIGSELEAGINLETHLQEIDFNGLRLFKQIVVDEILITFNIENTVVIFRFIQNQAQRGAASSSLIQENPYGLDILAFEIFRNLFRCWCCNFYHYILLVDQICRFFRIFGIVVKLVTGILFVNGQKVKPEYLPKFRINPIRSKVGYRHQLW